MHSLKERTLFQKTDQILGSGQGRRTKDGEQWADLGGFPRCNMVKS